MAGYQRTGFTEPFITNIDITLGDLLSTTILYTESNVAASTIESAISIEKTEHRNTTTYGRVESTLSVASGNGTIVPLSLKYNNIRKGDIVEDEDGYAYEVVEKSGGDLYFDRDVIVEIGEDDLITTKGKKLHLFGTSALKDYIVGEKVIEYVGGVGGTSDPYPILKNELLSGYTIPDTNIITDTEGSRTYYFNTDNLSSIVIDIISDKGSTIVATPLLIQNDWSVEGKPSDTLTIASGGGVDKMKYSDVTAPNIKIVVTKTEGGDMASYTFSVHGLK